MEPRKLKIDILPNPFLKADGTFDKTEAFKLAGKIAGVCYSEEGFANLLGEKEEKTMRRVAMTLNNGHHSVYDHIGISFNLQNIPKLLAMVLNNEHQYTTSEKSARYTLFGQEKDSVITNLDTSLYQKWLEILRIKIKEQYGNVFSDSKIEKLALETARNFLPSLIPTQMIYTTSLRQINNLAAWMLEYIDDVEHRNATDTERQLAFAMKDFFNAIKPLGVLDSKLMSNEKHRRFSLFGTDLAKKEVFFGDIYATSYKGSIAQFAETQRHRTLDNQMEILNEKEYFLPLIVADDQALTEEWFADMQKAAHILPQGELVQIYETGKYDDFILNESRFSAIKELKGKEAEELLSKSKEDAKARIETIKKFI